MLHSLDTTTENSIFIIDDGATINFDELPKKTTFLFTSSEFAARMGDKPERIEAVFTLEQNENKVDYRQRFDNSEDLIFELADEIYRCYKKEAKEYFESDDKSTANIKEEKANQIHPELNKAYNWVLAGNNSTTTLVWLQLKSHDDDEEKQKLEKFLYKIVSSFRAFDCEHKCHEYLRVDKSVGTIFLIVNAGYESSVVVNLQQCNNVQAVYRYGEASSKDEIVINNYNDLCFRVLSDLFDHYNRLGFDYNSKYDAPIAKDMHTKIH